MMNAEWNKIIQRLFFYIAADRTITLFAMAVCAPASYVYFSRNLVLASGDCDSQRWMGISEISRKMTVYPKQQSAQPGFLRSHADIFLFDKRFIRRLSTKTMTTNG